MKTSCFHNFIKSFYACNDQIEYFPIFQFLMLLYLFRHSNHVNGRASRRATDYSQL